MKLTIDDINATALANYFVSEARQKSMGVGHRDGGTQGNGAIPKDTGALQKSIYVSSGGKNIATVQIGNEAINYAAILENAETLRNGKPNLHKAFVERFLLNQFREKLAKKLGVSVRASVVGVVKENEDNN